MKRLSALVFILIFLLSANFISGEENIISVSALPCGTVPLGSSSNLFNFGFGAELSASWMPASFKYFGARSAANFIVLPLAIKDSIWIASVAAGPAFVMPLGERLLLSAYGSAGYYYFDTIGWNMTGGTGGDFVFSGGAEGSFQLTKTLALGLGVSYDYYLKLYNGIGVTLAARMDFPLKAAEKKLKPKTPAIQLLDEKGKGVELRDISLSPLFPVLYKYYDNNPVGTVRVKNFEKKKADEIKIRFFVERYMDNPMDCSAVFSLDPGEERTVDLFAMFTEDMMEITEGTKASAKISLSWSMEGKEKTVDYNPVIEIYNRNALVWDDDRKIASFITAKDPEILAFSKKIMTWISDMENPSVDENFQKGMAIFEAVNAYGVRYETDPSTPFAELSGQKTAVDFLQFPRQTLNYTNGDCDDLTSLYTSMLEAVGVETAAITIPGHIYGAFALKASPEEARRTFSKPDELIITGDKVWVPVEITMFRKSFAEAWQAGAKEWRENNSKEQAVLYPTRESWKTYQAVGFREGQSIQLPDRTRVCEAFKNALYRHVEREIYPQEVTLKEQIRKSSSKYKYKNRLAVLYARYGLYDRAEETFKDIVQTREYKPALVNLGNLSFIKGKYESALVFYQRVIDMDADNKPALLGVSRCNHELENYGLVGKTYKRLKELDPDLARRFAYLDLRGDEASRAADAAGMGSLVLWEEEE